MCACSARAQTSGPLSDFAQCTNHNRLFCAFRDRVPNRSFVFRQVNNFVVHILWSGPLRGDGSTPSQRCGDDGVALQAARRCMERKSRVGGLWFGETLTCLRLLAILLRFAWMLCWTAQVVNGGEMVTFQFSDVVQKFRISMFPAQAAR